MLIIKIFFLICFFVVVECDLEVIEPSNLTNGTTFVAYWVESTGSFAKNRNFVLNNATIYIVEARKLTHCGLSDPVIAAIPEAVNSNEVLMFSTADVADYCFLETIGHVAKVKGYQASIVPWCSSGSPITSKSDWFKNVNDDQATPVFHVYSTCKYDRRTWKRINLKTTPNPLWHPGWTAYVSIAAIIGHVSNLYKLYISTRKFKLHWSIRQADRISRMPLMITSLEALASIFAFFFFFDPAYGSLHVMPKFINFGFIAPIGAFTHVATYICANHLTNSLKAVNECNCHFPMILHVVFGILIILSTLLFIALSFAIQPLIEAFDVFSVIQAIPVILVFIFGIFFLLAKRKVYKILSQANASTRNVAHRDHHDETLAMFAKYLYMSGIFMMLFFACALITTGVTFSTTIYQAVVIVTPYMIVFTTWVGITQVWSLADPVRSTGASTAAVPIGPASGN